MIIIPSSQVIPKELTYRAGINSDREMVVDLVHTILKEYGLVPEPDGVDSDLNAVEDSYRDGYFGVVEYANKVVATYGLMPLNNKVVEIRKMYALPSVRGKGLGRWMVNHLLEIAKHNGYKQVELETASPLVEAIGLYQKMGFIEKDFENKTPRCNKSFYMNI
ncbi:MAG: GNAT family N-acetyltransferase [Bacteroidota bacterium]